MGIKNMFFVKSIKNTRDFDKGMNIILKKHYLKRKPPCKYMFALYDLSNNIMGVITYGIPPSHTLLKGVCGEEEKVNVIELNRLYTDDNTPQNAESFFVSKTLKQLPYEIIVSFAEIRQGHTGYIYQACNFLYCGLSSKFKDPKVKGLENKHHATYAKGLNKKELEKKFGKENVYYVDRPRKHRYIYLNTKNRTRKKELLAKLNYPIKKFPKG